MYQMWNFWGCEWGKFARELISGHVVRVHASRLGFLGALQVGAIRICVEVEASVSTGPGFWVAWKPCTMIGGSGFWA
jgi:hypothetical protein